MLDNGTYDNLPANRYLFTSDARPRILTHPTETTVGVTRRRSAVAPAAVDLASTGSARGSSYADALSHSA